MKKASAIIISAAMAAIMALGTGCGAAGERPEHNTQASAPAPSAAITATEIAPSDFEQYGVSENAETAYTLTATVYPVSASDKTVDWTIAWANAESAWATGKTVTDYVTAQAQADGSTVCIVSCLQAFGEQIEVTVTSRANENATATCTLDYTRRLLQVDIYCTGTSAYYWEMDCYYSADNPLGDYHGEEPLTFHEPRINSFSGQVNEVYTVEDVYTYVYAIEYNQKFLDVARAVLGESVTINGNAYQVNSQSTLDGIISTEATFVLDPSLATLCDLLFNGMTLKDMMSDDIWIPVQTAYTAFLDSDLDITDKWFAKVHCTATGAKSTMTTVGYYYLSTDSDNYTPVESVTMSDTNVAF